ncbi:MAG: flagellar filament capping protein FliD [Treponema sp.]|nr:flagellar filament capping protein FliD [Treponema sp.]
MSDVYIPGVRSRFNSEQLIEDLMRVERVPQDRVQRNIENLQAQKGYWQELGRRISSVRDSARFLYSFQNPFNERIASSTDSSVITASATREASEQSYFFTVKQTAQADRFLSSPLDERMRIESGTYTFTVGEEKISMDFRGGTLRDFVDLVNRRGRDKVSASLITIQTGTRSLLLESKITGAANRLGFQDDTTTMAVNIGMMEQVNDSRKEIRIAENSVQKKLGAENININEGVLQAGARSSVSLPIGISLNADSLFLLQLETSTKVEAAGIIEIPQPPPGPSVQSGSVTYGGITIENDPSLFPKPEWSAPPQPVRIDEMAVLSLTFSDGSTAKLPPITDTGSFTQRQYPIGSIAQGRAVAFLNIENTNTHRDIFISNIEILDPTALSGGYKPKNAVSTARDSIVSMEGIEIYRQTNSINDLIPGLTLNVRGISDRPVELNIKADTERIKEAIITFVGNYNRLLSEINVLTSTTASSIPDARQPDIRGDTRLIDELTYLSAEEAAAMRLRLGAFSGDTTLSNLRNNLQRIVSAPYPTSLERDLSLLAQIGISTNASDRSGTSGGYDIARLRGYLEINEKALDTALENKVPAIKELFGSDTNGDLIADTGIAVNIDTFVRPFVDTGGIITLKTNTIDSRISQDQKRVDTMEKQLAAKEQELKIQYARMESAYARMESMATSLDNFNQQNRNNNR